MMIKSYMAIFSLFLGLSLAKVLVTEDTIKSTSLISRESWPQIKKSMNNHPQFNKFSLPFNNPNVQTMNDVVKFLSDRQATSLMVHFTRPASGKSSTQNEYVLAIQQFLNGISHINSLEYLAFSVKKLATDGVEDDDRVYAAVHQIFGQFQNLKHLDFSLLSDYDSSYLKTSGFEMHPYRLKNLLSALPEEKLGDMSIRLAFPVFRQKAAKLLQQVEGVNAETNEIKIENNPPSNALVDGEVRYNYVAVRQKAEKYSFVLGLPIDPISIKNGDNVQIVLSEPGHVSGIKDLVEQLQLEGKQLSELTVSLQYSYDWDEISNFALELNPLSTAEFRLEGVTKEEGEEFYGMIAGGHLNYLQRHQCIWYFSGLQCQQEGAEHQQPEAQRIQPAAQQLPGDLIDDELMMQESEDDPIEHANAIVEAAETLTSLRTGSNEESEEIIADFADDPDFQPPPKRPRRGN